MTEIYNTINDLYPVFMKNALTYKKLPFNLRNSNGIVLPPDRTSQFGTENIRFIGKKVWQMLPDELKESATLYN